MAEALVITKPKLLIVEGEDERRFFTALLTRNGKTDIQVLPIGGKTKLHPNLKALVKSPNFISVEILAVTRDADDDHGGAFQSVCDSLRNAGLSVPSREMVFSSGNPRTAVMIVPAADTEGMLEDVCLSSVAGTAEMECVAQYFDCIEKKTGSLPGNISKARLHTYLAAKEPGLRLGEAAEKGLWQWDNSAFKGVADFVNML